MGQDLQDTPSAVGVKWIMAYAKVLQLWLAFISVALQRGLTSHGSRLTAHGSGTFRFSTTITQLNNNNPAYILIKPRTHKANVLQQ
jgi:hypothetical protein